MRSILALPPWLLVTALLFACSPSDESSPSGPKASAPTSASLDALRKAANLGDSKAQLELARRYDKGDDGLPKNSKDAFSWYLKAAEFGLVTAMVEVARRYESGDGTRRDRDKAQEWWKIAAQNGDADAQLRHANRFGSAGRYGAGIWGSKDELRQNAKAYLEWLEKAAAQRHSEAQYQLAMTLVLGGKEIFAGDGAAYLIHPNKDRGLALLQESAASGYWEAQIAMASLYQVGFGSIRPDKDQSEHFWQKVSQHSDPTTLRKLGSFYREYYKSSYVSGKNKYHGRFLTYDETNKLAAEFYEKAAAKDDPDAVYALGKMYQEGVGVFKDERRALDLFKKGAALGHYSAQRELGYAFLQGKGVVRDYSEALKWLSQAANEDETGSWSEVHKVRNALGVFYEYAYGVERDLVLAYAWYNIAAAGGYEKAKQNRARVEKSLTSDELREAQELSREWIPNNALLRQVGTSTAKVTRGRDGVAVKLAGVGSGFFVSSQGHILTNEHVVEKCAEIRLPSENTTAKRIVSDQANDLALLITEGVQRPILPFQRTDNLTQGEDILVFGFPLDGYLPASGNITVGVISALAGPGNNASLVQITAPVQLGNSGGPLLNKKGRVIGMVVGKANAIKIARATGDIPQNINFAIASRTIKSFLDGNKIPYETASDFFAFSKDAAAIAEIARKSSLKVECWR